MSKAIRYRDTMLRQINELKDQGLDYATALAMGATLGRDSIGCITAKINGVRVGGMAVKRDNGCCLPNPPYLPAELWEDGGPVVDAVVRLGAVIERVDKQYEGTFPLFKVSIVPGVVYRGKTIMQAACRCLVAHAAGKGPTDTIEIPDELLRA